MRSTYQWRSRVTGQDARAIRAHDLNDSIAQTPFYKSSLAKVPSEKAVEWADQLLAGRLALGKGDLPVLPYNPSTLWNFDWGLAENTQSNSYRLWLFTLRPVYILSKAYDLNPNRSYLELAEDFVASFHTYYSSDDVDPMTVNDHAISDRVENLIYLHSTASRAGYRLYCVPQLVSIVHDGVERMLHDKSLYAANNNHGILTDKAGLIGAYFLNAPNLAEQVDFLIGRIQGQLDHAFGRDGVHVENSYGYHVAVLGMFWGCWSALHHMGHLYCDVISERLESAYPFIIHATKPDCKAPLFGDTTSGPAFDLRSECPPAILKRYPELKYVTTFGKHGSPPGQKSVRFPSGYAFFRQHFSSDSFEQATWLSLKAGYTTRVHKQQDDLSIIYYTKGHDVFVDSGMAGYTPRDHYKDYMDSAPAHSTITLKDRPYSIAVGNGSKFAIQRFRREQLYDYALASSRVFEGVGIYRHLYFLRAIDVVLIHDEVLSETPVTAAQYFNLSRDVSLTGVPGESCNLQLADSNHVVSVRQLGALDAVNLLHGESSSPMSLLAVAGWTCEPSDTLEYLASGTEIDFVTTLTVEEGQSSHRQFKLTDGKVVIEPDGFEVPLTRSSPVRFGSATMKLDGDKLRVESVLAPGSTKFTIYVYRPDGKVDKLAYTRSEELVYPLVMSGRHLIFYFVANDTGEIERGVLGEVQSDAQEATIARHYESLHRPAVLERSTTVLPGGRYRFEVDVEYDFPARCSWWVYRNGARVSYEQTSEYSAEYSWTEPGDYVVMYSLQDALFGEFMFDQFDVVRI